jgi:cell division protein FtsB
LLRFLSSLILDLVKTLKKEYGGLKMDQAKRLKELEKENGKLKRLVAELSLDKQILKDIAEGNF